MEAPRSWRAPACVIFVLALVAQWWSSSTAASCSFTISNHCAQTIWPATLAGAGTPQLATTGFRLDPGQSVQVPAPAGWSGRIWARTGCDFSGAGGAAAAAAAGAAACQTGDCGGRLECGGTGATPPATLFEVTLGKGGGGAGAGDLDYYDVSLVDGYNLPVVAVPQAGGATGGGGGCATTGCTADLNRSCPKELQVDGVDGGGGSGTVACRSACEAFGEEEYCCSGAYATPATCRPTAYSAIFKTACPRAYSYAYDDGTSTFTCSAAAYTIAFCLPPTGSNTSGVTPLISSPSPANGQNGAGGSTPPPAGNNGAGISSYQPPPTEDINGAGSADQPAWMTMPSSASKRMMPSSSAASTRHNQLWSLLLLLPALLLFHFKQELL
ncbi:pathogenesis-related thaumatin-like protein 3.5 [Oryza glaberrima]|uniref:Thaumatin-like protein n=1 Tax=Oryza glaberrima TaxID=4538 RepID=I1QK67_ORYGL|nr:pathogenesis-related thaumatin-like protein 3.5 [Oryza glaberrima]